MTCPKLSLVFHVISHKARGVRGKTVRMKGDRLPSH